MIAVDTQVLVYAHREDSPFHLKAAECVDRLRHESGEWAIPWPCVHEFISVVTHPKIYRPPTPLAKALAAVENWAAADNLHFLGEGRNHLRELIRLATAGKIVGPQIHDARIAAICVQHGIRELWSVDRDFSAFPSLTTRNPLAD